VGPGVILSRPQLRLLLPLGAGMALSLTGDLTMYSVLANETDVLGIGLGVVGILLSANRLIRIPGNILAGGFYDRLGRRPLFLTGLTLGILSTLSYSVARGFWPLLGGRVLWGISWSLINVGGYSMILDRSTAADRGRMTGLYQMAFMLGLTVSPLLGGTLTDALGFRLAVRWCAAVSALGLVLALVALPETRPPSDLPPRAHWHGPTRQQMAALLSAWRRMDRQLLAVTYLYLVTFFVNGGVLVSTVSLYLKQRWGESVVLGGAVIGVASLAGAMLAMRAGLGMIAGPLAGFLSDRLHNRWPVIWGAILLAMAGFGVLALPAGAWAVPVGVALAALSTAGLITAIAALVGDRAVGERQGLIMGGLATAGDLGSALGPLVAYALAVAVDLRWVYLLCALGLASGLVGIAVAGSSPQPAFK
jgi:MFS family permease